MEFAATGTVRANRMENTPLQDMIKINKEKCGSSDLVTDVTSSITALRWKDDKLVNTISNFTGEQQFWLLERYCHREKRRVNIEQPDIIKQIYQPSLIYHQSHLIPGEHKLDAPGFQQAIVQKELYHLYRKSLPYTLFTGSRSVWQYQSLDFQVLRAAV